MRKEILSKFIKITQTAPGELESECKAVYLQACFLYMTLHESLWSLLLKDAGNFTHYCLKSTFKKLRSSGPVTA